MQRVTKRRGPHQRARSARAPDVLRADRGRAAAGPHAVDDGGRAVVEHEPSADRPAAAVGRREVRVARHLHPRPIRARRPAAHRHRPQLESAPHVAFRVAHVERVAVAGHRQQAADPSENGQPTPKGGRRLGISILKLNSNFTVRKLMKIIVQSLI